MLNRKRNKTIYVRVTEKEKNLIEQKFKISGEKTMTDFVIKSLIYSKIYKINMEDLREFAYEINRVGNNINQITKRINQTGNIYKDDISEIEEKLSYLNNFSKKYYDILRKFEEVTRKNGNSKN